MYILRCRLYSKSINKMNDIAKWLDEKGIQDFDIVDKVQKDVISFSIDDISGNPVIYIPREFEYSQYEIDDVIREMSPSARTRTNLDRDVYVMKLTSGSLNSVQCSKLLEKIIDIEGFCSLIIK